MDSLFDLNLTKQVNQITIPLSKEEDDKLQYYNFRLQALTNAFNLINSTDTYSEKTIDIVIEKYTRALAEMRALVYNLAVSHGHTKINANKFEFLSGERLLIINL